MKVLLLERPGLDLYHTLLESETSRQILRFYHPKKRPCGLSVIVASIGSALSLAGELKWYRQRYMREILFELSPRVFCTHALAKEIYYERDATILPEWEVRKIYGFRDGKLLSDLIMDAGTKLADYQDTTFGMVDTLIEVWCIPDELGAGPGGEESADNPPEGVEPDTPSDDKSPS